MRAVVLAVVVALAFVVVNCNYAATKFTPNGSGGAMLSASPTGDLALGTVILGHTGATTTITVSNDGDATSGPIELGFDDMTLGFEVTDDTCTGVDLDPGATCTFGVDFSPTIASGVQTNLRVSAQPGGVATKVLFGTGLVQGAIDITDDSYAYANQGLGSAAGVKVFTVRNTGQSQLGTPVPSTSSGDASYVVQDTTCTGPLNQTDSCTVTVAFAPTSVGQKAGSLVVIATPGGGDVASLSGTAFAHVAVTVATTGGGSAVGSVASTQTGISCPPTCSYDFTSSPITLNATPNATSTFSGWGSDCSASGSGACTLALDAPKTALATFAAKLYAVNLTFSGPASAGSNSITSSPSGISCPSSGGCSASFPYNSSVTLTANPDPNLGRFTKWTSGPCNGSASPVCTFPIPAATTAMTGTFTWYATLTIGVNNGISGSGLVAHTKVVSNDNTINCTDTSTSSGTCTYHYPKGYGGQLTYSSGTTTPTWATCINMYMTSVFAMGSGACLGLQQGTICSQTPCAGKTCTFAFGSAGDYTSTYGVVCQ